MKIGRKSLFVVCFLFLTEVSGLNAQSLAPNSPSKEYIYFGGLLIAVEQRGTGSPAAVKTAATTNATPTTTAATPAPISQPTLPGPGTQASSAGKSKTPVASFETNTPAETHAAKP